ncbi:hypothetical protein KF707C_7460 [Metapseudomonas furukawaii]|uniref:Uncharacterized protein n=1 Tax=Metapseudomonas furukawaii TaxID=1149133 RepID=A0AAD1FDX8_METFU|nr:hypothetical protein KF707C_7460 [Pseudomonas furukawaii]
MGLRGGFDFAGLILFVHGYWRWRMRFLGPGAAAFAGGRSLEETEIQAP